jgi:hypothetical protein
MPFRKQVLDVGISVLTGLALALATSDSLAQTLPISGGGTGATTAPAAISNLGLQSLVWSVSELQATGPLTIRQPSIAL